MLPTAALQYDLPEDLIARQPADPRDSARMLVVSRTDPTRITHAHARDLPSFLNPGDAMVVNDSRVLPARLTGARNDTGGKVEGLFLATAGDERTWRVMLKAKRPRVGSRIDLTDPAGLDTGISLELLSRTSTENHRHQAEDQTAEQTSNDAAWIVHALGRPDLTTAVAILDAVGSTPLPPYIRAARTRGEHPPTPKLDAHDRAVYQTIYANSAMTGSVAAPTAGLHFTPQLLAALQTAGISRHAVTLHVGLGTFKPVQAEFVEQHPMHAEWCTIPPATAAALTATRKTGGRILAIGTTSARTLESFSPHHLTTGGEHWTRLLITPGHTWQNADALLTNFHLPGTTLMAMVASLLGGPGNAHNPASGVARLQHLYALAIAERYRFYSFGDAMLILP